MPPYCNFEIYGAKRKGSADQFFSSLLAAGAAAEWAAKLTTEPSVRGRSLPDVRMMRPAGVPREVWFAGDRKSVEERIASLIDRTVHAIAHHDFEGARRYCREEDELRRLQEADFR